MENHNHELSSTPNKVKLRTSVECISSQQDWHEHADSPMRKRPRLDSAGAADETDPASRSSPSRAITEAAVFDSSPAKPSSRPEQRSPASPSTVNAPNKVTLNLRSNQPRAALITANSLVETTHGQNSFEHASLDHVTCEIASPSTIVPKSMDLTAESISSSPRSPPVVEIEVDDSDDIDDDSYSAINILDDDPEHELRLMDGFPFAAEHGAVEAASMLANAISGKEQIDTAWLVNIADWLEDWLRYAQASQDRAQRAYTGEHEFWNNLGVIYAKFLNRKIQLNNGGGRPIESLRVRIIQRFFGPYLELINQLIEVDLKNLRRMFVNSEASMELVSTRHLKNLETMFKPCPDVALWRLLTHFYQIDVETIQQTWAVSTLQPHTHILANIIQYTKFVAQHTHTWSKLGAILDIAGNAMHNITSCMRNYLKQMAPNELPVGYTALQQNSLEVVQILEQQLLQDLGKQNAMLSIDLSLSMARLAASILYEIALIDPTIAQDMFTTEFQDMVDIGAVDIPRVLRECLFFRLMWKFVAKGRMELRVQGVMSISEMLVGLWRDYNTGKAQENPILQLLATMLLREQVLEYLVSVESHPQLIGRSRDIWGFLFVTHRWTREMTDHFWSTVVVLQDRRISAAAMDVYAGILSLSQPSQLLDFVEKLFGLPISAFGPEVRQFMRTLLTDFTPNACSPAEGRADPQQLCVHLLQLTNEYAGIPPLDQEVREVHALAFEMLQRLSLNNPSSGERAKLYKACLHEIQTRSKKASGSIDSIFALATVHKMEDLQLLTTEMDLPRILAQEICAAINASKESLELLDQSIPAWKTSLKLFTILVTHSPDVSLSPDLEVDLWDHLIGEEACSDSSRDAAWVYLRDVITNMERRSNPLIDRLIEYHLPVLLSNLFTFGMFKFTEASMQYMLRVNPPLLAAEEQTICVPLSDLVWRIILDGPNDTIAECAIALLSQYHLDSSMITKAPTSSVAVTHTKLIDRCVKQLEDAAAMLMSSEVEARAQKSCVHVEAIDGEQTRGLTDGSSRATKDQLHFVRTLQFLQKFLSDVKSRPIFREASQVVKSPSSMSLPEHLEGQVSVLKYQAFTLGKPGNIRELRVSNTARFSDLYDSLCAVTGFTKISIICSGKILDLSATPEKPSRDLADKGLLIVRNLGTIDVPRVRVSESGSAAEKAVAAHFDTFYSFLDLSEYLSSSVFEFLDGFAAHSRVREAVLHEPSPLLELFPAERRIRTLYSICSLRKCLIEQLHTGATDELFILQGVRLLTTAITDSQFYAAYLSPTIDEHIVASLVDCLLIFLKERPVQNSMSSYLVSKPTLVDRLYGLLLVVKENPALMLARSCGLLYSTIIEVTFHSSVTWDALVAKDGIADLHYWLLTSEATHSSRDRVRTCIENTLTSSSSITEAQPHNYTDFYWRVFYALIARSAEDPEQSKHLLAAATTIFSKHAASIADEASLRSYMMSWTELLCKHRHSGTTSHTHVNTFVFGLARLLSVCVSFLKSFKKPVNDDRLMDVVFNEFLFPPLSGEIDAENVSNKSLPVLDDDTRKELYNLCLSLSETAESYRLLVSRTFDLLLRESQCEPLGWNVDRSKWLRTPTGHAGLKNLTNTCYMNSLLAQLFMNPRFRAFMLSITTNDETSLATQLLLAETQILFANMQNGTEKFAETGRFAYAIQPYDSEHIDVNVQMDVDEFYNLLFDRWESQLPTPESKQEFRAFYGGQLVTQIKSMDCDHVSEREEPFLAIQCDVKGKGCLADSLKAYVEGDVMEGDNKYKCESCGGRLVNAVKRSCLKNLPDNLIFHLKRFDFDLATLQRSKINDEFRFGGHIDMTPYHVEHLNNPTEHCQPDIFELVGVLVHNGTAETGHYYSYIRLPKTTNRSPVWAEFNDIEVSDFDPSKIPDQCFGGVWEQPGTDLQFPKSNNAYMLFYQRVPSQSDASADATLGNQLGLVDSHVPTKLEQDILASNEVVLRRYCLFGPTHALFLRSLVTGMKHMHGGICSDDHGLEHEVLSMALEYLNVIFARVKDVPDVDALASAIKRICGACGECCSWALKSMVSKHENTSVMLLQCPIQKVRSLWADLIAGNLQELRRHDVQLYGLDISDGPTENLLWTERLGCFQEVVTTLLALFPTVGKHLRAWDEYFGLWSSIVHMGIPELGVLLSEDLFRDCLELLLFDKDNRFPGALQSERNLENVHFLSRTKRSPILNGLVRLIYAFMLHTNPFANLVSTRIERLQNYNSESRKFPLMPIEHGAIVHVDRRTRHMPFISKIMEAMEQEQNSQQWYPGEIISILLNCQPPANVEKRIAESLELSLGEWLPAFSGFLLKSGTFFCRYCSSIEGAVTVITAAALNAQAMAKHAEIKRNVLGFASEYAAQGGQEHLNFFKELAYFDRSSCATSNQVDHLFKLPVIKCSGAWGPPLLLFDEKHVREDAVSLLESLIFDRFPEAANEGHQDDLTRARTEVVRLLFDRCRSNLAHAERYHMPRTVVRPTLNVMERCARWLIMLHRHDNGLDLRRPEDDALIAKYQEVKKMAELWRDEDGDGSLTETEWASQFDEDESDDMTEN